VRRASVHRGRTGGLALVAVLWMLALLTVLAAAFAATTRTEGLAARSQLDAARAAAVAEAAVYRALFEWLATEPDARRRADGTMYEVDMGEMQVRVAITDEGGRIDLNAASRELLDGLMASVEVPERERTALLDALFDWRDPDGLRRPQGAERAEYEAAGLPYGPRNGPFESVAELRYVLGMTPALYERLAPALTVHTRRPHVDIAVAPREVLLALPDFDAPRADEWLAARAVEEPARHGWRSAAGGEVLAITAEATLTEGARAGRRAIVRFPRRGRGYTVVDWESAPNRLGEPAPYDEREAR
jgi:general secretion pathway protein K